MENTNPKNFVFVLMPFSKEFQDTYELGIKSACQEAGAYCERVDEQFFEESILERLYNQISKADIIVSDMTGKNPNVFYETGYAHALNKRVMLVTKEVDDIPFDLKHYPHIVHNGSIKKLKTDLEAKIRWAVKNPKESLNKTNLNLEIFVNGTKILDSPTIKFKGTHDLKLKIDLHNNGKNIINPNVFSVGMVIPSGIEITNKPSPQIVNINDEQKIVNINIRNTIFPDAWGTFSMNLKVKGNIMSFKVMLRVFTEFSPLEFPFKVTC